jgi:myosin-9
MAKSLYSALFDWIVFRINHALLNSKDLEQDTKVKICCIIFYLKTI